MTKPQTELHQIQYKFSEEEISGFSKQLANACQTKEQTETEKKEAMSSFKAKIDSQNSHIGLLSSRIALGFEFQTQPCEVVKDFKKGTKQYLFQGKIVDTVKLTPEDQQLRLDAEEEDQKDLGFLGEK